MVAEGDGSLSREAAGPPPWAWRRWSLAAASFALLATVSLGYGEGVLLTAFLPYGTPDEPRPSAQSELPARQMIERLKQSEPARQRWRDEVGLRDRERLASVSSVSEARAGLGGNDALVLVVGVRVVLSGCASVQTPAEPRADAVKDPSPPAEYLERLRTAARRSREVATAITAKGRWCGRGPDAIESGILGQLANPAVLVTVTAETPMDHVMAAVRAHLGPQMPPAR